MEVYKARKGNIKDAVQAIIDLSGEVSLKNHIYLEQVVFLIFLKIIDEGFFDENNETSNEEEVGYGEQISRYEWGHFSKLSEESMAHYIRNSVFPYWSSLESKNKIINEVFNNAKLQIESGSIVYTLVNLINEIDFSELNNEQSNQLFDELIDKLLEIRDSKLGQYSTPRHLAMLMAKLLDPQPGMDILDPSCGTGMFLAEVYKHVGENHFKNIKEKYLTGVDISRSMVRLSILNMVLNGIKSPNIERADFLREKDRFTENIRHNQFDRILAHPPFAGIVPVDEIRPDLRGISKRTEILFLSAILNSLKEDGVAAVIQPNTFLASQAPDVGRLRQEILFNNSLLGIVSLPRKLFEPMISVSLNIILIGKKRRGFGTQVQFFDMETAISKMNSDFELGFEQIADELLDIWRLFRDSSYQEASGYRAESEIEGTEEPHYWWASLKQIEEKNDDLSFNLYRPRKKEKPARLIKEIWNEIEELNEEIDQEMRKFRKIMRGNDAD